MTKLRQLINEAYLQEDSRSLKPLVATILNYIKGLRTADTQIDSENPYVIYIPITRNSNLSYIQKEATKRLRNSKLSGSLTIEPSQLIIKINKTKI